jgi:hypothetical protein
MPENQDFCRLCTDGGDLICCDSCIGSYHGVCLDLDTDLLPDPWKCPQCILPREDAAIVHDEESCLSFAYEKGAACVLEKDSDGMPRPHASVKNRRKRANDEGTLQTEKAQQGSAARLFPKLTMDESAEASFASTVSNLRSLDNRWPNEDTVREDRLPLSESQQWTLPPKKKLRLGGHTGKHSVLRSVHVSNVDKQLLSDSGSPSVSVSSRSRQSRGSPARESCSDKISISKQASAKSHGLGSTTTSVTNEGHPGKRPVRSNAPGSPSSSPSRACDSSDTDLMILPLNVNETEETEFRRWACVAYETEMQVPHPVLRHWLHPIRYASVHRIADHETNLVSVVEGLDMVELSWNAFSSLASKGQIFSTPLLIREAFTDSDEHSPCGYADALEQTFIDTKISVRYHQSEPELLPSSDAARLIRMPPDTISPKAPNFLDLDNLSNAIKPGLTRMPRFRLLERLVRGARAHFSNQSGKQTFSTPFDVGNCQSFDILGLRGAFSGAHVDALGGTWLRNLFGTKLWMFVPQALMTEQDWKAFGKDGPSWDPESKARAVILRPGDVFFMPPGLRVIHAVLTLETSLMCGGMLWDDFTLLPLLQTIHWIGENQKTTNEALPHQLGEVLNQLERVLSREPNSLRSGTRVELDQAIQDLRSLGCKCVSCDEICMCLQECRRCTPLCANHSMGDATECMQEPLVEGSDDTGSIFDDG